MHSIRMIYANYAHYSRRNLSSESARINCRKLAIKFTVQGVRGEGRRGAKDIGPPRFRLDWPASPPPHAWHSWLLKTSAQTDTQVWNSKSVHQDDQPSKCSANGVAFMLRWRPSVVVFQNPPVTLKSTRDTFQKRCC